MQTYQCKKCGASDFRKENGKIICNYCNTVYLIDENNNPHTTKNTTKKNKKNINSITTKRIAVLALMVALTIIFSFVPISFGTVTLALMIFPTLLIAQVEDFKTTVFLGLFLGLINYIAWFTTKAGSPLAPVFQNPLVCILPRILIGVVSYWVGVGLRALVKKIGKPMNKAAVISVDTSICVVSTALGVVTNTLFVGLFTLLFFNNKTLSTGTAIDVKYILAWFSLNFAIEVVSFSVLVPPIAFALKKAKLVSKPLYFVSPVGNNGEKANEKENAAEGDVSSEKE